MNSNFLCYKFWQGFTGNRRRRVLRLFGGGKSELHRAAHGVMPLGRKVRNSETERMSAASSLISGTGDFRGAGGVKTVKLCAKQDQIGKRSRQKSQDFCRFNSGSLKTSGSDRLSPQVIVGLEECLPTYQGNVGTKIGNRTRLTVKPSHLFFRSSRLGN